MKSLRRDGRASRSVLCGSGSETPEALVRDHGRAVLAICIAHTRNVHDAEDLMQQVFLKVAERFSTLRDPRRGRAWLMQIARRVCADYHRRRKATRSLPEDVTAPAGSGDPRLGSLHEALSRLPEHYRETISLYYLDGRSCSAVAAALGVSQAAVRQRLVRARLMLHELMSEDR